MDTNALIAKLKQGLGASLLKSAKFGKVTQTAVWVEAKSIVEAARILRLDRELMLDWLEAIEAMEMEGALVLTYLFRSHETAAVVALRLSAPIKSQDQAVALPSITSQYPSAATRENELSELFGIAFDGIPVAAGKLLAPGWSGFPMRKAYLFPTEFAGIPHMRPVGRTAPDEHGVLS